MRGLVVERCPQQNDEMLHYTLHFVIELELVHVTGLVLPSVLHCCTAHFLCHFCNDMLLLQCATALHSTQD
jgi:hypothetical protein